MSSQPLLKGLFDELDSFPFLTGPEVSRPLIAPAETQLCTPDYQRVDVDTMIRYLAPFSHASRKKKGRPTHEIVVLID